MEIMIAMAAGFLLGAFIRKPFVLFSRKEKPERQEVALRKKRPGEVTIEDELKNMVNYTGLKE